jgi:hypothetical protein
MTFFENLAKSSLYNMLQLSGPWRYYVFPLYKIWRVYLGNINHNYRNIMLFHQTITVM